MGVTFAQYKAAAMEIDAVRLMIYASDNGGILHYKRDDGTDLKFKMHGRPVILSSPRPGVNTLGRIQRKSIVANSPTGEAYTLPIEDSMQGWLVQTVPLMTPQGIIVPEYRIKFEGGEVVKAEASDDVSTRVLQHYTGLKPWNSQGMVPLERAAFYLRRIIAEFAIAGFNPVFAPYIESGRYLPVIGNSLETEKVGDHVATGANSVFPGGLVPAAISAGKNSCSVKHTDFIGTTDRRMKLYR